MSVGETYLTVQGRVGGDIRFKEVAGRVALASFRLGTTPRQFDKTKGGWTDRPTTWFTVECWRTLAENVNHSLKRGHPVVVTGRLKTTEWTENGETRSRTVLDALSVGHDLTRGKAIFTKNPPHEQTGDGASLDEEMRDLSSEVEEQVGEPLHNQPRTAEPTDPAEASEPSPFPAAELASSEDQSPGRRAA